MGTLISSNNIPKMTILKLCNPWHLSNFYIGSKWPQNTSNFDKNNQLKWGFPSARSYSTLNH